MRSWKRWQEPPSPSRAQHRSSSGADVTPRRRRLCKEGLSPGQQHPLLAADAPASPPHPDPPDPSFHSAPAQPEPSPCSASPCPRCCAAAAPAAGLCGTRRDPGARHRGGPGRDEVVAVPVWPRVCQRGGVNSSLCTVEIQRALGICMIKARAEAVWAPFIFFFFYPGQPVLRAETLWTLLACVGRSRLNPWLQNQVVASSD